MFFFLGGMSMLCFCISIILFFDFCEDVDRGGQIKIDFRAIAILAFWFIGGALATNALFW